MVISVATLLTVKNGSCNKWWKPATTVFHVLERYKNCTFVQCRLLTGRTHQIRVHMAYIGHPLIGDPKYCNSKN